jgi:hypothetical protein
LVDPVGCADRVVRAGSAGGRLSGMRPWRRAGPAQTVGRAREQADQRTAPTSPPGERAAALLRRIGGRPAGPIWGARTGRVRRQDDGWVSPGAEGQELPKVANHLEASWSALLFTTIDAVLPDPVAKGRVIAAQLPGDPGDRLAGGAHQLDGVAFELGVNCPLVLRCLSASGQPRLIGGVLPPGGSPQLMPKTWAMARRQAATVAANLTGPLVARARIVSP